MNHLNQEPLDFAGAVALMQIARAELTAVLALLKRIRASINTSGELSVICMQDIDAHLERYFQQNTGSK